MRTTTYSIFFLLLLFTTTGGISCVSPEHDRTREHAERIRSPEELREQAHRPGSGSDDPRDWHVNITMETAEVQESIQSFGGIRWQYDGENVLVEGGKHALLQQNGIRVGVAGEDVSIQLEGGQRTSLRQYASSMSVLTLNNRTATVEMRRERPVRTFRVPLYGRGGNQVIRQFDTRVTGFSLRVRPRIVERGPWIELDLTPIIATAQGEYMQVTELQSTVRVRSGESIILADARQSRASLGTSLFHRSENQREREIVWILTPEILK